MMNTADTHGYYSVVYDGSESFPDTTTHLVYDGIVAGQSYLFRVKAKY